MQCYRPLSAFQNLQTKQIVFTPSPKEGHYYDYRPLHLPCGQCTGCRLEQSRQWAVRIMHEAKMHKSSSFITLTYEQEPEHGSLDPKHLTDFWKRLRKRLSPTKLRYFAVGEYGEKTHRPHYHAIIFGTDFFTIANFTRMGKIPFMYQTH